MCLFYRDSWYKGYNIAYYQVKGTKQTSLGVPVVIFASLFCEGIMFGSSVTVWE